MGYMLAVAGAVTTATRLTKSINKYGCLDARVVHTPPDINTGGCSYSVKLTDKCLPQLMKAISEHNLKKIKIYHVTVENGESVYNDISG